MGLDPSLEVSSLRARQLMWSNINWPVHSVGQILNQVWDGIVNPKYRVDELNEFATRLPGILPLFPLLMGDLLIWGLDLKTRRWDHYSLDRSYCGPIIKGFGRWCFLWNEIRLWSAIISSCPSLSWHTHHLAVFIMPAPLGFRNGMQSVFRTP